MAVFFVLLLFYMDSLTQIVLGAAVGNAVAGKKLKNRALVYGALAGTIPDMDILVGMFLDPVRAVEIHRGISHSVFFAALVAVLLGWLVSKIERKSKLSFKEGYWLFFLGLFTHALLDMFTTWGTRLLWPVYSYPFAFKSVFVIDPLYTIPFIVCLILSMRQTENLKKRTYWNTMGLGISSGYLVLTLVLKGLAYQKFVEDLDVRSVSYHSVSVKPSAMNTILWNAIVDTPEAYLLGDYSFLDHSLVAFDAYAKNHHLLGSLREEELVKRLIVLSEGWYIVSEKEGDLYFNDLRFGLLKKEEGDVQFAFSYRLFTDDKGELHAEEVFKERKDGVKLLKDLWIRLQGR